MADGPFIEWHPPHLEKPILIPRGANAPKPMRPAVLKLGVALFALGVGVDGALMAATTVYPVDVDLDAVVVIPFLLGAPVAIIAGAVIMGLNGKLKPWLASLPIMVVSLALSYAGLVAYTRASSASDCERGEGRACVRRAHAAFNAADAARYDKRGCEQGDVTGCDRWGEEDPKATAKETFAAYCEHMKTLPHVPYHDGHFSNDPVECRERK